MDYKQAIAELVEKMPELATIITAHVSSLNSESADRRIKLGKAEQVIDALKKIAGDDADLVNFAAESKQKTESSDKAIADLQAKLDAALLVASASQRELLLVSAAQVSGADPVALSKLLEGVQTEKITVADQSVTVDGKPLKDFAIAEGKFWERALFAGGNTPTPEGVPTGGASPETPKTPAVAYLDNKANSVAQMLGATIKK